MLSAAKDILEPTQHPLINSTTCIEDRSTAKCSRISTGAVLLADIIPSLLIKLVAPFVFSSIAYNVRHLIVVVLQALSLIVVAMSSSVFVGLLGVVLTSFGAGLGDVTLLSMSSHFSSNVITTWSAGTGAAGVVGAGAYAFLTDDRLLALSPRNALLCMLVVPALFLLTFYRTLRPPFTVYRARLLMPSTYMIPRDTEDAHSETSSTHSDNPERRLLRNSDDEEDENANETLEAASIGGYTQISPNRYEMIRTLLKWMVPLAVVYFGEYFINYGLLELLIFDCASGFNMSPAAQYRWYQLLYQIGVFISRTSIGLCILSPKFIPLLAILQLINVFAFGFEAMHRYVGHIAIVFVCILYEGVLGGAAYANTFHAVHTSFTRKQREFSMGFVTMSDAIGIVAAGLVAIPAHNYICSHYF